MKYRGHDVKWHLVIIDQILSEYETIKRTCLSNKLILIKY